MIDTFTNRTLADWTIASIGDGSTTDVEGWTTSAPADLLARVRVGDTVQRETIGGPFGTYSGWLVGGEWVGRLSDQDIERERQELRVSSPPAIQATLGHAFAPNFDLACTVRGCGLGPEEH